MSPESRHPARPHRAAPDRHDSRHDGAARGAPTRSTPDGETRLSRRQLLRGAAAVGVAGLLAACSGGNGDATDTASTPAAGGPGATGAPTPTGDVRQAILDELGVTAPLDLVLAIPMAEFVTGEDRRVLFGLATEEREFLNDLDVEVTVVRDDNFAVVSGPAPARTYPDFGQFTIYHADVTYPEPGIYRVVAAGDDHAGVGAVQVVPPESSPIPDLGADFPSASTPTTQNPGDLEELCTREPDCSMHELSLDAALADGRPTVLTVATPAFCQTAICGPVVDVLEDVKQSTGRDGVAWIHVEVYKDAGTTPVDLMGTLQLPSEPWTFFIDGDGQLADKLEGPTPAPLVQQALEKI